jgi:hypothetical protein
MRYYKNVASGWRMRAVDDLASFTAEGRMSRGWYMLGTDTSRG